MDTYVEMPDFDLSQAGSEWLEASLPDFDFTQMVKELTAGENIFNSERIFNSLLSMFANELYNSIKILTVITAILIISALLENLRSSFNKNYSLGTEIIVVALVSALAGELFSQSGNYAAEISSNITNLMWSVLPALMTLTAGSGFAQTVVITNPILYFMCNVFAEIFDKLLIPLAIAYFTISLTDLMTDLVKLSKFRELIKKVYNFVLGFVMAVFTGLLTVSTFAGSSLDSAGAKGVKFAISSVVPFVGRSLSDAMGAVVSASMLLKNAVGVTAIIAMLAMCIVPVIKIAVVIVAVRISVAVCEPVSSEKSVNILSSVADSLSMINAAVIANIMMMIISLSLIVGLK